LVSAAFVFGICGIVVLFVVVVVLVLDSLAWAVSWTLRLGCWQRKVVVEEEEQVIEATPERRVEDP
jgi:hypothetical protein